MTLLVLVVSVAAWYNVVTWQPYLGGLGNSGTRYCTRARWKTTVEAQSHWPTGDTTHGLASRTSKKSHFPYYRYSRQHSRLHYEAKNSQKDDASFNLRSSSAMRLSASVQCWFRDLN